MPHRIQWLFFDLGSTLIDETEADRRRIREMTAGTGITEEMYCEKRLEMTRRGLPGDQAAISFFGLTKMPWHSEDEKPYPDVAPANRLGMHSVRLLRGIGAYHEPQSADEIPEHTIRTLSALFELIETAAREDHRP